MSLPDVFADLEVELERSTLKHGVQSLPAGTRNGGMNLHWRTQAQNSCDRATREGVVTWWHVIEEEVAEAACEEESEYRAKLRPEMIQAAAMFIKAMLDLDAKHPLPCQAWCGRPSPEAGCEEPSCRGDERGCFCSVGCSANSAPLNPGKAT